MPKQNLTNQTIDIYPFLNLKPNTTNLFNRIAVSFSWIPEEFQRRIKAYTILSAYEANLSNIVRVTPEDDQKEYGDAKFICTQLSNSLIGDDLKIVSIGNEEVEKFYSQWAEDELFFAKLVANEYKASNIGDEVFKLEYSEKLGRTRVSTVDPGFWFPFNLGERNERHVFAWEEERNGETQIYKEEYRKGSDRPGGSKSENVFVDAGYYQKSAGKDISSADLKFVEYAKDENGRDINARDLGVQFFPIIYIPNIYREGSDFGESDLTGIIRIIDELTNTYTDESKNARFMGLHQLWADAETFDMLPVDANGKKILKLGANSIIPGQAGIVDNSALNKSLMEYENSLLEKAYKNSNLGQLGSGKGQTSSADRTTDIVEMKGSILERFIKVKRLTRIPKYNKLLKYVAGFEMVKGSPENKKLFRKGRSQEVDKSKIGKIQFGNILPVDQTKLITNLSMVKDQMANPDVAANIKRSGLIVNNDLKDAATDPAQAPAAKPAQK